MEKTILAVVLFFAFSAAADPVFRFHLLTEPHTLDFQATSSASGNYLIQNLNRGLMRFDSKDGLVLEGAAHCESKKLELTCTLSKKHVWSDGKPITAEDYVRSFRHLIQPKNRSPQAELLFTLKNARAIWAGRMPAEKLGVEALNAKTVRFVFASPDADFRLKLAHPALSPLRSEAIPLPWNGEKNFSSGPYRIKKWLKADRVVLEPNDKYAGGSAKRPMVEALFIDDDSTALRLYEAGTLSFLRRLVSAQIPVYRGRPDFLQVPMARFDYIGFSPELKDYPKLRRALSLSLDFENFRRLFDALGRPGCPSLPASFYFGGLCLNYAPAEAKRLYQSQPWPNSVHKELGFSQMGGDDIRRAAEWFQGQWKKNLGLLLELDSQEQAVYLNRLKTSPPAVFRKGIGLDRPSCLAGLENFSKENPENFIHLNSEKYESILNQMRSEENPKRAKKLCSEAIQILIGESWIIPLGEIHFTMLASPKFAGWKINSLNQLDLAQLHPAP